MKSTTSLGVAALAVVALGAALFLRSSDSKAGVETAEVGAPLLEGFAARVNDVTRLEIATATGSVAVAREGDLWVLPERGSFPADMAKVRGVLLGLGELVTVEKKTANPARFGDLGLQTPEAAEAVSGGADPADAAVGTRVVARGAGDTTLADVVLGKSAQGARFDRPERYARLASGGPSWLVRGRIDADAGASGWMSKDLPKLARDLPTSVEIVHPDGERLAVQKDAAGTWALAGLPEGRELAWAGAAGSLAGALENWTPEDARARDAVPELDGEGAVTTTVRDSRGLVLEVRTVELDGAVWLGAAARVEAVAAPEPAPDAELGGAESGAAEATPPVDTAAAEAEAARWNALFGRFAVQLPTWTAAPLRKRTEELLKPLAPAGPPVEEIVEEAANVDGGIDGGGVEGGVEADAPPTTDEPPAVDEPPQ